MAGEKSNSGSYCLLRDTAAGEDSLGFKPYVEAIAEFLTAEGTLAPITLSIEGQWGCGKSSFMEQLKKEIEKGNMSDIKIEKFFKYLFSKSEDKIPDELSPIISFLKEKFSKSGEYETFDPCSFKYKLRATLKYIFSKIKRREYFTVWFNCWRFEKEDELWAAFALNLMEKLSEQLSWWGRQRARFNLKYLRLKFKWKSKKSIFLHIIFFISALCIFIFYSIQFVEFLSSNSTGESSDSVLVMLAKIVAPALPILYFWNDFKDVVGNPFNFSKFVSNPNYKEHVSFIEHFHSDFGKIIESYAGSSRVYVFVDDLDRCEVPKAAELMQALNLMISDDTNVYFSIGMDRKVISAGLAARNENILPYLDVEGLKYGYDFIEKFIQLPFKVPSPTNADFKKFLYPQQEQESSSKASGSSGNSLSKFSKELLSKFKAPQSSLQNNEESNLPESTKSVKPEEGLLEGGPKEESGVVEKILINHDCDEKSGESEHILEMIVPVIDRNPRRMKQFFNLFRFHRTIGYRTGLFSYNMGVAPENMWNCKKLAKFVAISMKWPSLVTALSSNRMLLKQLQEYALEPENEDKNLDKWIKDERLIGLLKYGCVEGGNLPQNVAEYTLSGLDFSKLLQISPVVTPTERSKFKLSPLIVDDMEFIPIPAGAFPMGLTESEIGRDVGEGPVHIVTIKNPFYLGKYQVTQTQWEKVMGSHPSYFKGDGRPVESVSWDDVQEFIKKFNEMVGTDKYRLPSESEWEYACRAGTTTKYSFGDDESILGDYAWYDENSGGETHPVGQKGVNPWGLYDMHGNVWEWVQDTYHKNYEGAPSDGGAWEDRNSSSRVLRGGGRVGSARSCRSTFRGRDAHGGRDSGVGFRLLRKL